MALLVKVEAIKKAVSLPPDMELMATYGAACELMGIFFERDMPLPAIARPVSYTHLTLPTERIV